MLGMISCRSDSSKEVSIGTPEFITDVPDAGNLKPIAGFSNDEIGINSVKAIDSLLFIGHAGNWSIYSLDGKRSYGNCLSTGSGPGEFLVLPRVGACYFFHDNDSLKVHAADRNQGKVLEFNITEFLGNKKAEAHEVIKTDYISNETWDVVPCKDSTLYISQPVRDFTGFNRMKYDGGLIKELEVAKDIDKVSVNREEDINLLARITRYNDKVDRVVEAMLYLNQMNILSMDGKWGKTICVGKQLDDLSEVESTTRFGRKDTYLSACAFDEGFGAVYIGVSEMDFQKKLSPKSELQFFDWEGNPVCKTTLPYQVLTFDLDFKNKVLYVVDESEDRLLAYDASPIIARYTGIKD